MKKITILLILLTVSFGYAQPTTNAPTPSKSAADVISVFSDAYTNVATNYNPNWGQSGFATTSSTYDPTGGGTNFVLAYTNFNYQGTELTTQNASGMEYLHVDIWTAASPGTSIIQVSPVNNGTGAGEVLVTINHTAGTWTSVDIPKSSFTGMTWDSVFQMKFAANGPGSATPIDVYVDNVYFWKAPVVVGTDATLSDLKVDGNTIAGFSSSKINYDLTVPTGTVIVPQLTAATTTQAGASAVITQATGIPGAATVVVTASDGITTKTYTVNIIEVGPATAAPTPPARAGADVLSVFSGAYTNVTASGLNTFAGASWANFTIDSADDTRRLTTPNPGGGAQFEFFDASPALDLSGFTHAHVDFYVEGPVAPGQLFQLFLINFPNYPSGAGSANLNTSFDVNAIGSGAWYSGDVLLSTFGGNLTRDKIALVQVVAAGAPAFGPIYIDNIYFHKNTTLATKNFEIAGLNVYPNPAKNSWNVRTSNINMSAIKVYDILGKNVLSLTPNATDVTINGSSLKAGLYFAQIKTANGVSSIKLVKE